MNDDSSAPRYGVTTAEDRERRRLAFARFDAGEFPHLPAWMIRNARRTDLGYVCPCGACDGEGYESPL